MCKSPYFTTGMHQLIRRFLFVFVTLAFFLISCKTTKTSTYFESLPRDTVINGLVGPTLESKIQKRDILAITVSSLSPELDMKFNAASVQIAGDAQTSLNKNGYLVNDNGKVTIHYLGEIEAAGLTRREFKEKVEKGLLPFLKEPIVTVQYLNRKVTVIGDVNRPQVIALPDEQISILDALVFSGDMNKTAKRTDVMIIREDGSQKKIKHVNMEDHAILSSPWYYLQPNDILYVPADVSKADEEDRRRNTQTTVGLLVSFLSLAIIILNIFVK
ncbi:MAG: polysaccharide biosynthesis/export family protein [Sphingobacteriales bacterium]|nr:polysaccharide biosynthesis/export family protein [Sphingobacteriales bacterium]